MLTCQLVSPGRPVICIRWAVRRGRGCGRSGGPANSLRWRAPRANWTVKRDPLRSDPSSLPFSKTSRVLLVAYYSRKAVKIISTGDAYKDFRRDLLGTTSRASMASSYSMKPKPFMSLTSAIVPFASLKWVWISSLVTTHGEGLGQQIPVTKQDLIALIQDILGSVLAQPCGVVLQAASARKCPKGPSFDRMGIFPIGEQFRNLEERTIARKIS